MNRGFRDLVAFKRGMEVVVAIYSVTEAFPKREMYGLVAQLRRAAIGIISHIGEGDGRITYGERRQFLSQSRGSLCEVEAQILAAHELNFLGEAEMLHITKLIHGTGRAITGLIRWVQQKELAAAKPRTRATANPGQRTS
jgi:four helix bundle protein